MSFRPILTLFVLILEERRPWRVISAEYKLKYSLMMYSTVCNIRLMHQQVEQQSTEPPEWIVFASLKSLEPQHWPFLLWKCTAGCSRPTATCCSFEWPHWLPSAACLFPEDCFYCLCRSVNTHLWSIVQHNGHNVFPFFYDIPCLYFGNVLLYYVVQLCGNLLWTSHSPLTNNACLYICVCWT